MRTDIQIAQANDIAPIADVARTIGLVDGDLELYGPYKAKLTMRALRERQQKVADGIR